MQKCHSGGKLQDPWVPAQAGEAGDSVRILFNYYVPAAFPDLAVHTVERRNGIVRPTFVLCVIHVLIKIACYDRTWAEAFIPLWILQFLVTVGFYFAVQGEHNCIRICVAEW